MLKRRVFPPHTHLGTESKGGHGCVVLMCGSKPAWLQSQHHGFECTMYIKYKTQNGVINPGNKTVKKESKEVSGFPHK